jgi:hypothetical protein
VERAFPLVKSPPNRFVPPNPNNPPARARGWGLDVAIGTPRTYDPPPLERRVVPWRWWHGEHSGRRLDG